MTNIQAKALAFGSNVIPTNWSAVDYWQRVQILDRLNQELGRQGLPIVTEEILHWRMAHILPPLLKEKRQESSAKSSEDPSLDSCIVSTEAREGEIEC